MERKIVAIITRERSGSTVLQRFLKTRDGYDMLGEMWNVGNKHTAFYDFWHEKVVADPSMLRLSKLEETFDAFVKARLAGSRRGVIMDVKYGHLDSLRWFWAPGFDKAGQFEMPEPSLMRKLKKDGAYIFHLTRRNKIAVYVSLARAQESGVWRLPRGSATSDDDGAPLEVDDHSLLRFIVRERQVDALVHGLLEKHERFCGLEYEDIFPADMKRLEPRTVEKMASFLDEDPNAFNPVLPHRKIVTGALRTHIKDAERLRAPLSKIDAEWMLDA